MRWTGFVARWSTCRRWVSDVSQLGEPDHTEVPGEKVRVITPEQLHEGYVRMRGIGDPGDRYSYAVIRRLDDGNYLVRDPT